MNAQEAIEIVEKLTRDYTNTELNSDEYFNEIEALNIVLESAKFLHENLDLNERTIDIEDGTLKYNTPLYINPVAQEKLGIKGE